MTNVQGQSQAPGAKADFDAVAEKGYEGFVFTSQGQSGTAHTIAAE